MKLLWGQIGEFGLDGTEALVGPVVMSVPVGQRVKLGAELVEAALVPDDLGFGLGDVGGQPLYHLDGGCLLLAAAAAQLGEPPEFFELLLRTPEAVPGGVQIPLR
jgi:hypothetical protein